MKRYRILSFDFDTRVNTLTQTICDEWEEHVKELHRQNRQDTENGLILSFGKHGSKVKIQNFIDLGVKPFSILAFHNRFFEQIRTAFVMGAYYPALTAACSLGERILNYLVLILRDDFKSTPEYKAVCRKNSFDNWDLPIDTLESWKILLPNVAEEFRRLKEMRNKAIHFRPETDNNDRELSLNAIQCVQEIIRCQFSAFGSEPWFLTTMPGEIYIKKEWEKHPFVQKIYLPNCLLVGPKHSIVTLIPTVKVRDEEIYDDREITDEEFAEIRKNKDN